MSIIDVLWSNFMHFYSAKVIVASVSPGCSNLMSKTDGYKNVLMMMINLL